ncbi:MAG: hypothetical protein WBF77_02580, partial [Sulfurimonadaceae bacterium]
MNPSATAAKIEDRYRIKLEQYNPGEPIKIKTVAQMTAYCILRADDATWKKYFRLRVNLAKHDAPVETLWEQELTGPYNKMIRIVIREALAYGLCVPVIVQQSDEIKKLLLQNQAGDSGLSRIIPETFGELCGRAAERLERIPLSFLKFAKEVRSVRLDEMDYDRLLEKLGEGSLPNFRSKHRNAGIKNSIECLRTVLSNAIEMKWLEAGFYWRRHSMLAALQVHIERQRAIERGESKETPVEERKIVWYLFEVYREHWDSILDFSEQADRNKWRSNLGSFYKACPDVVPVEWTREQYKTLRGRARQMIRLMHRDGLDVEHLVLREVEESHPDDLKMVIRGVSINVERLEHCDSVMRAIHRLIIISKDSKAPETLATYVTAGHYLAVALKAIGLEELSELNNGNKQRLYDYMNKLEEDGKYDTARALIKVCRTLVKERDKGDVELKKKLSSSLFMPKSDHTVIGKPRDFEYPMLSDREMRLILGSVAKAQGMSARDRIIHFAMIVQLL